MKSTRLSIDNFITILEEHQPLHLYQFVEQENGKDVQEFRDGMKLGVHVVCQNRF